MLIKIKLYKLHVNMFLSCFIKVFFSYDPWLCLGENIK